MGRRRGQLDHSGIQLSEYVMADGVTPPKWTLNGDRMAHRFGNATNGRTSTHNGRCNNMHAPSTKCDVHVAGDEDADDADTVTEKTSCLPAPELRTTTIVVPVDMVSKSTVRSDLNELLVDGTRMVDERDVQCGLGSFRPRWLQILANKKVFLAVFCLTSVLQGMYYTYFVSVLTTIEKLFQIQSKTTGIIMSATEMGQIGGALLLTYYGGHGHRPKWIACGMLLFAFASFFCSLPHFLFGNELSHTYHKGNANGTQSHISCGSSSLLLQPSPSLAKTGASFNDTDLNAFSNFSTLFDQTTLESLMLSTEHPMSGMYRLENDSYNTSSWTTSEPNSSSQMLSFYGKGAMQDDMCGSPGHLKHAKITQIVLAIFFTSLLFIGIGATAVLTLGIPYIDDNVANRDSPLYFGITIGVRILGPVFGFLLGSFCTSLYVNPFEYPDFTNKHPQWIGAWWLGLFIVAAALLITSFAMLAFPRELPHRSNSDESSFHRNNTSSLSSATRSTMIVLKPSLKEPSLDKPSLTLNGRDNRGDHPSRHFEVKNNFPIAMRRLLKNEVLLFRTVSSVLHILPIAGLYTFLPKYIESQFQMTATEANMISGMAGILVMGVGIFGSGIFMRRFKLEPRVVAGWIALTALAYSIGMVILMFIGCPLNDYKYLNGTKGINNLGTAIACNTTCPCDRNIFAPVCTTEGITYFSACHAGCQTFNESGNNENKVYSNCECLGENVTATSGSCSSDCNNFVLFVCIFAVFVLILSTSEVGSMLLTLRCVDPKDKAMALGLISFAIGLFGNVPCPIVYGAVVDSACLIWKTRCGERGACQLYDPVLFRTFFYGTTGAIMFVAFIVDLVVWYKATNIHFLDEDPSRNGEESAPIKVLSAQTNSTV